MSQLADDMIQRHPTLDPEWVRAICTLAENRHNQRFLISDKEEKVHELTDEQLDAAGFEKRYLERCCGWCWVRKPWYKMLWIWWEGRHAALPTREETT